MFVQDQISNCQTFVRSQIQALRNVPVAPSGYKVILLGDSAVGKSSLVHRVKEGTFSAAASQPTIGGSKLDRAGERQVGHDEARTLARGAQAQHLECSSKDGTNVDLVFERVAEALLDRGLAAVDGGSLHAPPLVSVAPLRRGSSSPPGSCGCV